MLGQATQGAAPPALIIGHPIREAPGTAYPVGFLSLTRCLGACEGWRPARLGWNQPAWRPVHLRQHGPRRALSQSAHLLQRVPNQSTLHLSTPRQVSDSGSALHHRGVRDILTALLRGCHHPLTRSPDHRRAEILRVIRSKPLHPVAFPPWLRSMVPTMTNGRTLASLVRGGRRYYSVGATSICCARACAGGAIQLIYAPRGAHHAVVVDRVLPDRGCANPDRLPHSQATAWPSSTIWAPTPPAKPRVIVASPNVRLGLWVSGRCVVDGVANNEVSPYPAFPDRGFSYAKGPTGLLERLGPQGQAVKIRGYPRRARRSGSRLRQACSVRDVGAQARTAGAWWRSDLLVAYVTLATVRPTTTPRAENVELHSLPAPCSQRASMRPRDSSPAQFKLDVRALTAGSGQHRK